MQLVIDLKNKYCNMQLDINITDEHALVKVEIKID